VVAGDMTTQPKQGRACCPNEQSMPMFAASKAADLN